jgi:hypothetical protein
MRRGIWGAVLLAVLCFAAPLGAQRPIVGFGIGGGVILGSQLLHDGFNLQVAGEPYQMVREVELDQIGIFTAGVEVYPIPHVALRGHGAWGSGALQVQTTLGPGTPGASVPIETWPGRVRVSAIDAGVSLWPWAPHTVGFAPFVTVGFGRFTYDFDASDSAGVFNASGERKENSFIFGVGADMSVWRSITLRMEALNSRVPSPLRESDFAVSGGALPGDFDQHINNISLSIGVHMYLPFASNDPSID